MACYALAGDAMPMMVAVSLPVKVACMEKPRLSMMAVGR